MHGFAITSNDANLDAIDIALIFVSFIIVVLIFSFFVKLYYRIRHNKRYYIFPRIGIKGIANIAMVISIAVAAILLLTLLTAGFLGVIFRAYPGWRIVVEGILIKIGGLLFGPMIGLFIGGCTDLLSIALTSGMFHYGYFIAAVFYGFFAGLIRSLLNFCKKQQVEFIFIGSILSVVIMLASIIYISTYPGNIFDITFLIHISMPKWFLVLIIAVLYGLCLTFLWIYLLHYNRPRLAYFLGCITYYLRFKLRINYYKRKLINHQDKQNYVNQQLSWFNKINRQQHRAIFNLMTKKQKVLPQTNNWFAYFAPVLFTVLIGETIINIFFLPAFDHELGGGVAFSQWLVTRTLTLPVTVITNIIFIYSIYRIVAQTIHYDYRHDMLEVMGTDLMVE